MPRKGPPAKHPIRGSFQSMHNRCYNPWQKGYKYVGAKGVKVARAWWTFESFLKDMEPSWFPGAKLARHNVARDYSPGNCYWRQG